MHKHILDALRGVNSNKNSEDNNEKVGTLVTCFFAPVVSIPSDIPISPVEVNNAKDVINSVSGILLMFDASKLEHSLRFFQKILEEPSAFGLDLIFIKNFPEATDSPILDRLVIGLPSVAFDEWKSSLVTAVSVAASATRNPANDRLRELQDKNGKIHGTDFPEASMKGPVKDDNDLGDE